jgi:ABC-2 type transport system permease protein
MVFASVYMLYGREAWHTNMLMQEPVYFLSGSYFPTIYSSVIPFWVQVGATLIPMTVGLDAIRRLTIAGGTFSDIWLHIVAMIAFSIVLLPLARKALSYMESLGKREGRLTLRWQ